MAKTKSPLIAATGRLISSIQKVWGSELGEPYADFSQDVMGRVHTLLRAGSRDKMLDVLDGLSLQQYLGDVWLRKHPEVLPFVVAVEEALEAE